MRGGNSYLIKFNEYQTSMQDRKLIKVLMHFSEAELNALKDFIASPFFNKDLIIKKLYECIFSYLTDGKIHLLTTTKAFEYIDSQKQFNKEAFTKLLSKLYELVQQFMIHKGVKKDEVYFQIKLLEQYYQSGNINLFKNLYKKIVKQQSLKSSREHTYYYNNYLLAQIYSDYLSVYEDTAATDIYFQKINDSFDKYFVYNKLWLFSFMKNRQRVVIHPYDYSFINSITEFVDANKAVTEPSILLWYQALCFLDEINEKNYQALKMLLYQYDAQLSQDNKRVMYTYLENASRQVFKEQAIYYQELFELYNIQLQKKIIYTNHYLPLGIFQNIVIVALRLKKSQWLEAFLKKNEYKIQPNHKDKEIVYNLCLGMVYFEQEKFDEALDTINKVNSFKNINIYTQLDE